MIEQLLARLDGVKRGAGRNSWVAKCPAHEDRSPSLSVAYEMDGRILLHCFAGCEVESITGALGMDLGDLMPPKEEMSRAPTIKVRVPAMDLLSVLHLEAGIVMVAAHNIANGVQLGAEDLERLTLAYQRIDFAMERAGG